MHSKNKQTHTHIHTYIHTFMHTYTSHILAAQLDIYTEDLIRKAIHLVSHRPAFHRKARSPKLMRMFRKVCHVLTLFVLLLVSNHNL